MPSRELSFGANAALNLSAWFIPAVTALIAVRITVRGLGADAYGLLAPRLTSLIGALAAFAGVAMVGIVVSGRGSESPTRTGGSTDDDS